MDGQKILQKFARETVDLLARPDYKFLRIHGSARAGIDAFSDEVHRLLTSSPRDYSLLDVVVTQGIDFEGLCRMCDSQNGRILLCLKDYDNKLDFMPGMYDMSIDALVKMYSNREAS